MSDTPLQKKKRKEQIRVGQSKLGFPVKKPKKGLTEAGLVFGISPKVHVQE